MLYRTEGGWRYKLRVIMRVECETGLLVCWYIWHIAIHGRIYCPVVA